MPALPAFSAATIIQAMRKRSEHAFASDGFSQTPDTDAPMEGAPDRCSAPGCEEHGLYPAPRDRGRPRPYLYFCLEHVRAYNAGWDYYRGMSAAEIEEDRRLDFVWRRQTWTYGGKNRRTATADFRFEDPLAAFQERDDDLRAAGVRRFNPAGPEARAQAQLGLDDDFDLAALKIRYKTLVKRWHPDANDGSTEAEERLKTINEAYRILRRALGA